LLPAPRPLTRLQTLALGASLAVAAFYAIIGPANAGAVPIGPGAYSVVTVGTTDSAILRTFEDSGHSVVGGENSTTSPSGKARERPTPSKPPSIEEGHLLPDHVHMLLSIPPKYAVSNVVGYIKGKSAIHLARTCGERKRNFVGQSFWARGYFVSTIGRDEKAIRTIPTFASATTQPL
jgi:Transposase IS200 like